MLLLIIMINSNNNSNNATHDNNHPAAGCPADLPGGHVRRPSLQPVGGHGHANVIICITLFFFLLLL